MRVESAAGGDDRAGVRRAGDVNARRARVGAAAAPAPAPAAPPAKLRAPEEILADAVKATGGAAAWNAHKTAHYKVETTLQGMGMGGTGERYQTARRQVADDDDDGRPRHRARGNERQGRLDGGSGPGASGISTAPRPSRRGSRRRWNADMHAAELFAKLEAATEPGPDGAPLECVVATPKLGAPLRSCYDAKTHLQVSQSGVRAGPQGDMPFRAIIRDWRDVGGVKIPFESNTQLGPITTVDRVTAVTFDEPIDDKMFDPPKPPPARRR